MKKFWCTGAASLAGFGLVIAHAQPATGGSIYTCIDAQGRRITSDRPIAECLDGRTDVECTDYSDWTKAWTEIKG